MDLIGYYPYPNKGISLWFDGSDYWHKGHGQTRKIARHKAIKLITTFFGKTSENFGNA